MAFSTKFVEAMRAAAEKGIADAKKRKELLIEQYQSEIENAITDYLSKALLSLPDDVKNIVLSIRKVEAETDGGNSSSLYLHLQLIDSNRNLSLSSQKVKAFSLGKGIAYTPGNSDPVRGYITSNEVRIYIEELVDREVFLYKTDEN